MESKAEFYDDVIKQQPNITMSSHVIKTFISTYTNCFNAVTTGSNGVTKGSNGVTKGSNGVTKGSNGVTKGSNGVIRKPCNTVLFSPAKADLSRIIKSLSDIVINLKSDISNLNTNIEAKLEQIGSEKELNEANSGIFSNINTSNSGAKIMIDDYKTIYNTQYYKNVELFIGAILMLLLSAKIFRK
jgi:hypothetical protein